jgi:hypothetical protein
MLLDEQQKRGIRKSCAVRLEQAGGSVAAGQSACKWRVAGTVRKSPQCVFFFPLGGTRNARTQLVTHAICLVCSWRHSAAQVAANRPDGEQLLQLQAVDPRARRAAQARDGQVSAQVASSR